MVLLILDEELNMKMLRLGSQHVIEVLNVFSMQRERDWCRRESSLCQISELVVEVWQAVIEVLNVFFNAEGA